jgi:NADH-quinone oxidoreductase subunit J
MFGVLVYMTLQTAWPVVKQALGVDAIGGLGEAFVGAYALPFEVVSIVLLVALVGAIIIAREK